METMGEIFEDMDNEIARGYNKIIFLAKTIGVSNAKITAKME